MLPKRSARGKPTSIERPKHIMTAVLKLVPIVSDVSSEGMVSL